MCGCHEMAGSLEHACACGTFAWNITGVPDCRFASLWEAVSRLHCLLTPLPQRKTAQILYSRSWDPQPASVFTTWQQTAV